MVWVSLQCFSKITFYFYLIWIFYYLFLTNPSINGSKIEIKRPNIVYILVDDWGWGDVGLHGSKEVRTPNIDILASNGIILNNYYVSPICSPSRGSLMTGRHPIHIGLQRGVFTAGYPEGLSLQYKILPQYLKDLGYETHAIGKWHLGYFQRPYLPTHRGFDSHFGFWNGHSDYYNRKTGNGFDFRDNESRVSLEEYRDLYSTHIYTNKSIDIIMKRNNSSKPLFLYLAHQAVHGANGDHPLQAPQDIIDRFGNIKSIKRRTFVAMVSALDDSIGEIFNALQNANLLNDTIIILSTDNGGAAGGIDGSAGSNWPLRGSKFTLFEGGIRGFSFIWSPLLKKQYVSQHLMHIQDWLPTIYSAVGGRYQDLGSIDGIDMWDTLNNNLDNPRKQLLHNLYNNTYALRDGDYKLMNGQSHHGTFNRWFHSKTIRKVKQFERNQIFYNNSKVYRTLKQMGYNYKSVEPILVNCNKSVVRVCKPTESPCLFDIRSDPCEYNNLFEEKPEIVESMLNQLPIYESTAVKPIKVEFDPKSSPKLHDHWWDVWQ